MICNNCIDRLKKMLDHCRLDTICIGTIQPRMTKTCDCDINTIIEAIYQASLPKLPKFTKASTKSKGFGFA